MQSRECPACGLFNPASSTRCDCGHDFSRPGVVSVGSRPSSPRLVHLGLSFAGGVLAVFGLCWSFEAVESMTFSVLYAVVSYLVIAAVIGFFGGLRGWGGSRHDRALGRLQYPRRLRSARGAQAYLTSRCSRRAADGLDSFA